MKDNTPEACARRIENAIGIIDLRLRPNGVDLMPSVPSSMLMKSILLDAASLLSHFDEVSS